MQFCRGNQIVNLKLKIPTKLTDKQKELMKEFEVEEEIKTGSKAASSTSSSTAETEKSSSKRPFSLEQAWKRLNDFWGTTNYQASDTSSKK